MLDDMTTSTTVPTVEAVPTPFPLPPGQVALIVIDMQRDFLLPGGFGETLGNDVSQLAAVIPPLREVLAAARAAGMLIIHTREGHRPDLSDLPPAKHRRGKPSLRIGDPGPYGRILIRGEYGHDIIDELAPIEGETVIDKPGKGAFYATDLQLILESPRHHQLDHHRRHHRGVRAHHRTRGQRSRLRGPRACRIASARTSPSSSASAWRWSPPRAGSSVGSAIHRA